MNLLPPPPDRVFMPAATGVMFDTPRKKNKEANAHSFSGSRGKPVWMNSMDTCLRWYDIFMDTCLRWYDIFSDRNTEKKIFRS